MAGALDGGESNEQDFKKMNFVLTMYLVQIYQW
jgi:hypothetical protein